MTSQGLTLSRVNEITMRINSEQDLQGLLSVIMEEARRLLFTEGASLLLYDKESDHLIFDVVRGPRGSVLYAKKVPLGQGIAGRCAETRKPIIVNDAASDPRILKVFDHDSGFVTRNLIAVPMLAKNAMMGVLEVVNTRDNRLFTNKDVQLLTYISNMAAISIQNRQMYLDVQAQAEALHTIYSISQSVLAHDTIEELLDAIVKAVEDVLHVDRVSIVLRNEEGHFKLVRMHGFSVNDEERTVEMKGTVSGMVVTGGDPLLVKDMTRTTHVPALRSSHYKTSSFLSVPIILEDSVVGILNASDKKDGTPFDGFDLQVLSTVASQLADYMSRIESRKRREEVNMMKKDMETASMIQMFSLPTIPSSVAGMDIGARYKACKEVGGDFYDLIYHSEDRISLVMADVAGKGVPAALFMEFSKTVLASHIPRNLDPVTSLRSANEEIYKKSRMGLFVTCMIIQLEREFQRLRLASAGHNHQILFRKNVMDAEFLSAKGLPLGVMGNVLYNEKVVYYEPGDLLILYTDGITEARNQSEEEFGEERLIEITKENCELSPAALVEHIFEEIASFTYGTEPFDDTTLMILRL